VNQEIFEWILLLGRWVHIVTAMTWIGTSIFFMWLDRTIQSGELWMVHGGGFYRVNKLQMGPTKVPEHLHWFKWESYWTWISGMFLLVLIFYTGNGTFLLDSSRPNISYWQAVGIGLGSVFVSWIFYDLLWESKLTKVKPLAGHALTLLWFGGASYFLCHTLSGRAAYIHVGAMLGTWMTLNVLMRIIPRQRKMVEASKKGEPVNQEWAKNAKARSTHNTYFTLPVIFIMLSNHFPMTYGHELNWLMLLLVCAAGAAIRYYFVIRIDAPARAKVFAALGAAIILGVIIWTLPESHHDEAPAVEVAEAAPTGPAGTIQGEVSFAGQVPKGKKLSVPLDCVKNRPGGIFSDEVTVKDGKLKNVLVRITGGLKQTSFGPPPEKAVVLDQIDCMYEPKVVAARVGQKVEIVNSDPVFHNVRSITTKNENFNIGMAHQHERVTKVFTQPDMILQTKCDVHPWMTGYIAVVEHPYFAVTDAGGRFEIPAVPEGQYTLELWHETLGKQNADITVKDGETQNLKFTF
jgi:uncharacterized membrane protein/plastocyanin